MPGITHFKCETEPVNVSEETGKAIATRCLRHGYNSPGELLLSQQLILEATDHRNNNCDFGTAYRQLRHDETFTETFHLIRSTLKILPTTDLQDFKLNHAKLLTSIVGRKYNKI